MLDLETAKSCWTYEPDTGLFRWLIARGRAKIGAVAGHATTQGYWDLRVNNKRYAAHCVAWLMMTGKWPDGELDHRDRNRSHNRWKNIRPATRHQNCSNKSLLKPPKYGFRGVSRERSGSFTARIKVRQKTLHVGTFPDIEAAARAYDGAARQHFGGFAVVNFQ